MLRISRVDAQLSINSTQPKLIQQQPNAKMEMTQKAPVLEIHTEQVKVQISQRQCFNESGLKDISTLAQEVADSSKQAVMEAISNKNSEGQRLSKINIKSNAFAEIAANKANKQREFNMVTMPKSRPSIEVTGGTVDIRIHEGGIDIKVHTQKPDLEVQEGKVNIEMKQYPKVYIEYIPENTD